MGDASIGKTFPCWRMLFRGLASFRNRWGTPLRQVPEVLHRLQIRSPDHSLENVSSHLRHRRILGESEEARAAGASFIAAMETASSGESDLLELNS